MNISKLIMASLVSMLLYINPAMATDLVVIVNKANPVNNISTADLKKYFTGANTLWNNGQKAEPADLDDNNPAAAKFSEEILQMSLEKKRRMWVKKIFRGEGTPPLQFKAAEEVLSFVSSNAGGIGYVPADSVNDNVKKITVDGQASF